MASKRKSNQLPPAAMLFPTRSTFAGILVCYKRRNANGLSISVAFEQNGRADLSFGAAYFVFGSCSGNNIPSAAFRLANCVDSEGSPAAGVIPA